MPPSSPEWDKALRGELYHGFVPELIAARERCRQAYDAFNKSDDPSRRRMVQLWREITEDPTPLPPPSPTGTPETDALLFAQDPWILAPIHLDYGINVRLGARVFLNINTTFVDTCPITIGARTLVGPSCSFYSGTHPLDPALRNGTEGPELGKDIWIGEDCWLGGNVIVLPGVTIGRGCSIGAGSVVSRDIPPFHVAAGNPARVLRKIATAMDPEQTGVEVGAAATKDAEGAEVPMAEASR